VPPAAEHDARLAVLNCPEQAIELSDLSDSSYPSYPAEEG
jgi:hypothetical protein